MSDAGSPPDPLAAALTALAGDGVRRRELDRGGRMLRWVEAGDASPAIVVEAGAMSSVASFAAVFAALAPDHRVIAYDRAGYGLSDSVPFAVDQQVDDLLAVLEAAGPGPRVLVGHSWGGLLVQLTAWQRPDLVNGLVLVDPADERIWEALDAETRAEVGRRPDPHARAHDDPRSADVIRWDQELAVDIGRSVAADPAVTALVVDACLSYLRTDEQVFCYLDELPAIFADLDLLTARRADAVWPEMPVVVLTATKERPEDSTRVVLPVHEEVAALTGGRHVVVPDAGHYIHVDRPDLVIDTIREVAERAC